jgi:hypothetical protein
MKRLIFLILFFTVTLSAQTTYYVADDGDDANDGITQEEPWATPNKIYSFSNFQPGDSILFKRGDVFGGQILDTLQGSVGSPIVIGAYGTGAKPIIYGDLREVTWTAIAGLVGYYKAYLGGYSALNSYYYQWRNDAWLKSTGLIYRGSSPATWGAWLTGLAEGGYGLSGSRDTVFIHTYDNVTFPATRDSIRIYRYCNELYTSSHDVIVRDLDIRCFFIGLQTYWATTTGYENITFRGINTKNNIDGALYMTCVTNGLIDSCYADSTANTAIYFRCCIRSAMRKDTIVNMLPTVDGFSNTGDQCGIGIQGSMHGRLDPNYGYNTVEYNTLDNIQGTLVDFWRNTGDTIRYNTGTLMGGGIYPDGTDLMINNNSVTLKDNAPGNGMNCSNLGAGKITITGNTFIGSKIYGMWIQNDSVAAHPTATIVVTHNTVTGYSATTDFIWLKNAGITSDNNSFYGLGRWGSHPAQSVWYSSLSNFQNATGFETGSTWAAIYSAPITIALTSGNNQGQLVNTTLTSPFVVTVTDGTDPVPNVYINWEVNSVPLGAIGYSCSDYLTYTNINGQTSIYFSLGNLKGTYTIIVVAPLIPDTVTFTVNAINNQGSYVLIRK